MDAAQYLSAVQTIYESIGLSLSSCPAANDDQVLRVEVQFDHDPLLAPLIGLWRIADGSEPYNPMFARPGYITGYDLLSTCDALAEREFMRRRAHQYDGYEEDEPRDARIAPGWWNPRWLPFASFGAGSLLLILDLSPSALGRRGQIIAYTHDPDHIAWVAESLPELFKASADAFQADPEEFLEGMMEEFDDPARS